jgi:hypothetical protein
LTSRRLNVQKNSLCPTASAIGYSCLLSVFAMNAHVQHRGDEVVEYWRDENTHAPPRRCFVCPFLILCLALAAAGCRTPAPIPPADFAQPGWEVRHGQAVWKPPGDAPELAGELIFATPGQGRSFLQFSKTPFPLVVAQIDDTRWQIGFVPENRTLSGTRTPPEQLGWLHLMRFLSSESPQGNWTFEMSAEHSWRLHNTRTGEAIEGFFD